jgi:hypothetical protein
MLSNNSSGVAQKRTAALLFLIHFAQSFGGLVLQYRIWQIYFGRKRPADPCFSETRRPVRSDFHTLVTRTGLSVTFKPTNSTYIFVADNPVVARLGPVSFVGIQHGGRNTEDYNSDEVEAMARQVASEHASNYFCHFIV